MAFHNSILGAPCFLIAIGLIIQIVKLQSIRHKLGKAIMLRNGVEEVIGGHVVIMEILPFSFMSDGMIDLDIRRKIFVPRLCLHLSVRATLFITMRPLKFLSGTGRATTPRYMTFTGHLRDLIFGLRSAACRAATLATFAFS